MGSRLHETIEDNGSGCARILGADLMDLVTPCPSQVNRDLWTAYARSPEQAIGKFAPAQPEKWLHQAQAISKEYPYRVPSDYGELEITINLSKPEKDPKEIAAAKLVQAIVMSALL